MSNLFVRFLSAIVFVIIIMGAVFLGKMYFLIIFGVVLIGCLYEYLKITTHYSTIQVLLLSFTNASPYIFIGINSYTNVALVFPTSVYLGALFLFHAVWGIFTYNKDTFNNIIHGCFSTIYITLPFVLLQLISLSGGTYSGLLILLILILNWTNDTFAYLVGRLIGKTPLAKDISPNKTIEGSLGGVLGVLVLIYFTVSYFHLGHALIFLTAGLLIAIFGSLGDLFQSVLKRHYGIKDSGRIMPGHGGFLDRFDSFIFAVIVVYIIQNTMGFAYINALIFDY